MTIFIQWSIDNLEYTADNNKGVISVNWSCRASDQGKNAVKSSKINFTPNPESTNYISYDDLREPIVIEWVKIALNSDSVNSSASSIESVLTDKVNKQLNKTTSTGTPNEFFPE